MEKLNAITDFIFVINRILMSAKREKEEEDEVEEVIIVYDLPKNIYKPSIGVRLIGKLNLIRPNFANSFSLLALIGPYVREGNGLKLIKWSFKLVNFIFWYFRQIWTV